MRAPSQEDLNEAIADYRDWWEAWSVFMHRGDPRTALAYSYVHLCEGRILAVARGEPLTPLARKAREER